MIAQNSPTTEQDKLEGVASFLLGLDIGGTKTAVLLANRDFQVLGQVTRPTVTSSPEALVAAVLAAIEETLARAGTTKEQLSLVGIAVPGLVEHNSGLVRLATNLKLEDYPLGPVLAGLLQTPCAVENDVRAAALGAYRLFKQKKPLQHLAYLSIGTGTSAGAVLGGRLHQGAQGMAGEIGHVIVEPGGPVCSCGMAGCLEAVASGTAIARQAREALASGYQPAKEDSAFLVSERIRCETVFEALGQGDPLAREIVGRSSLYLARAIQLLVMAYDVELVVLGGGVSKAGPALLNPILAELARLRSQSSLAAMMLPDDKITLLPAGYNAGAWGAITMTLEERTHESKQP